MMYQGGKRRLAKRIVATILADTNIRKVWEPFCGGASVTSEFAKQGFSGLASDVHPALISMYKALQRGWIPPLDVTEKQYEEAKLLSDGCPEKAFFGFGCSFGGMWFSHYARSGKRWGGRVQEVEQHYGNMTRKSLLNMAHLWKNPGWSFVRRSFFDVYPFDIGMVLYCDPPYEGLTGYTIGDFDHNLFWRLCQRWAAFVPVYVSEECCPVPAEILLKVTRKKQISSVKKKIRSTMIDRLFKVRSKSNL